MAIGKRLRFQIFRRDNFACRYCGLTAAAGAVLEVDHVKPRVEGGSDVPANLVTACEGCNSGKSDIPLDAPLVEDIPQADLRAALAERGRDGSRDPVLSQCVRDLDTAATAAWHQGFGDDMPSLRLSGQFQVTFAVAVACGASVKDIKNAAYWAGQDRAADLLAYVGLPKPTESPEEELDYYEATVCLQDFIPWEQVRLIWRARAAAGDYTPTIQELTRAAAGMARTYVEEEGRDFEALRRWLDLLPGNEGSQYLVRAAAAWDAHWKGRRGHAAMECPDEVLELAIKFAIGAEVPA